MNVRKEASKQSRRKERQKRKSESEKIGEEWEKEKVISNWKRKYDVGKKEQKEIKEPKKRDWARGCMMDCLGHSPKKEVMKENIQFPSPFPYPLPALSSLLSPSSSSESSSSSRSASPISITFSVSHYGRLLHSHSCYVNGILPRASVYFIVSTV